MKYHSMYKNNTKKLMCIISSALIIQKKLCILILIKFSSIIDKLDN